MACSWILGFSFLLFLVFKIQCADIDPPPKVSGTFRAIGEIGTQVEIFPGQPTRPVQIAFEENYDDKNKMLAFTLWEANQNETFVENLRTNRTFQYIRNSECKLVTKENWIDIGALPALMGYSSDGKIRFPVQKFLTMNNRYLAGSSKNETYRGIPADMWFYQIQGKEENLTSVVAIYVYWSNSTWNTTAGPKTPVPLGFKVTKIVHKQVAETEVHYINVYAFTQGTINRAAFEAREGIQCEGDFPSELPFPTLPKMDAISIHSEIALASYLEVKNLDIWYDMKNKLMRIDMDSIRNQEPGYLTPGRRMTSEFTSKELGATLKANIYKGKMICEVTKLDNYEFEAQDIINPKLLPQDWDMHHFFGVNQTKYTYIGKTVKRNIPCHLFQGRRTDWPEPSANIESLWEWCFAVKLTDNDDPIDFRDNEQPLVSAQIYFLKSFDDDFPEGSRLVHHFYDVLAEDPNVMYSTAFDISRCFNRTQKQKLQFTVDAELNSTNIHIFENATSNPVFLQQWRDQICLATGLTLISLRVTGVKSAIYNNIMYVTFTLLDVHPELPDKSKQKSLADAQKNLSTAIDKGSVQIKYTYQKGKSLDLKAKPKTLGPQIDPTLIKRETTSATPPITKPGTSTEPTATESNLKETKISGNGPGTVAAVTVAMLIVGISLGASGTYYKYKGLPLFCRRA